VKLSVSASSSGAAIQSAVGRMMQAMLRRYRYHIAAKQG
jgi:hypothetical protein